MNRSLIVTIVALVAACASSPSGEQAPPGPEAPSSEAAEGESEAADQSAASLAPEQRAALRVSEVEVRPAEVTLRVGETVEVEATPRDSAGEPVPDVRLGQMMSGRAAAYDQSVGVVEGVEPGEATFYVMVQRPGPEGEPETVRGESRVTVEPLPVTRLEIGEPEQPVLSGTRLRLETEAWSEARRRDDAEISWESSDPAVARVSAHGLLRAGSPGTATLTATAEEARSSVEVTVAENPVRDLEIAAPEGVATVGEVIRLTGRALDAAGDPVERAPIEWNASGPGGSTVEGAYIREEEGEGLFVADRPGLYRITAAVGSQVEVRELEAEPREYRREIEEVGHGVVEGRTTSDLWVFEAPDGRDYAYTGTHAEGAGGNAMFAWDVTDPSDPAITDSVIVDARVVNDVKINEDRTLAVITREGASNRRNGIVILDIADPAHPTVITDFTENLTAGVHNTWIEGDLVYAVNDGTRALHIIDISDPADPREAGRWQLDDEHRYLHDVIVQDGLAYLSYWDHGLVILDVGNGIEGGTPTDPAFVSRFQYRTRHGAEVYGNSHHAIPHGDYIFVSDEIFGCSECVNGPRGFVHVLDASDIENLREVAWYRVPEAGNHNMWVEDDRLYTAYYQGGFRVVDISGELRGDLYEQGREIGWYMTESEDAFRPNSAMAWGPQPHKGNIFVSDMNSGLWVLRLTGSDSGPDGSGGAG